MSKRSAQTSEAHVFRYVLLKFHKKRIKTHWRR